MVAYTYFYVHVKYGSILQISMYGSILQISMSMFDILYTHNIWKVRYSNQFLHATHIH